MPREKGIAGNLISLLIALILTAILLPIGLIEFTDESNWIVNETSGETLFDTLQAGGTLETLLFTLVPIMVVISIVLYFVKRRTA